MKIDYYTVEQLEEILIEHYSDYYENEDIKFNTLLSSRKQKLDNAFQWTPESIEKILVFDKKLNNCFETAYKDAKLLIAKINKRTKDKNDLLNDFEMKITITPYISVNKENEKLRDKTENIKDILDNYEEEFQLFPNYCKWEETLKEYQNKEWNWNNYWPFRNLFKEQYVSPALYRFHSNSKIWSIPDILKIKRLWTRLNVDYQYDVNV